MAVTQYIGARYVPLLADPMEWDENTVYEPLTIVLYQGNSYTSRQYVPKGISILNEDYWAPTGNYNAQVEAYRQEVRTFQGRLTNVETKTGELEIGLEDEASTRETADTQLQANITAEATARVEADTALQGDITAEAATRAEADTVLQGDITAEATAREIADNAMQDAITAMDTKVQKLETGVTAIQDRIRIGSFYTTPVYKGSFTAYNGFCQDAQGKRKPYLQQGMTYTENNNFAFFVIDGAQTNTLVDIWVGNTNKPSSKSDTVNNRIGQVATNLTYLGHANCAEYDPESRKYFVITGESQRAIVRLNSDYTLDRATTFPPVTYPDTYGSGYGAVLHDRKTGKWYAVQHGNGRIFTFDPESLELTATGKVIDWSRINQGMALYDNVLVAVVDQGGDPHSFIYALECYDITTGDYIASFALPEATSHYPLGEIEDLSFTDDGTLYMACLLRYEGTLDYCGTTMLCSLDIFTGHTGFDGKRNNYTQPPLVFVEPKYQGFFSNGTSNYPLKTLDELTHLLSVMPKTRTCKLGLESAYSSNNGPAEEWFGFLQLTGTQATIQMNSDNHVTIMGGVIARDNAVLRIRNKLQLKGWYGQATQAYLRADDSIVLAQDIQCIENTASGATTFTGVFDIPGTGMLYARSVTKPSTLSLIKGSSYNGGFGYVIGQPKTGTL